MDASKNEPMPKEGGKAVIFEVIQDFISRAEMGKEKYGQLLKTNDGRNNMMDLYQELIDAVMYCKKQMMEENADDFVTKIKKVMAEYYDHRAPTVYHNFLKRIFKDELMKLIESFFNTTNGLIITDIQLLPHKNARGDKLRTDKVEIININIEGEE